MGHRHFTGGRHFFGSPTSLLIRANLLRQHHHFYNEKNTHADTEACLQLLRDHDFGFVHQVLTFTRRHNEAQTTRARRFNTYLPSRLYALMRYGRYYLSDAEYHQILRANKRHYYRFLVKCLGRALIGRSRGRGLDFWTYHAKVLAAVLRTGAATGAPEFPLMPPIRTRSARGGTCRAQVAQALDALSPLERGTLPPE
jgi:hypothetical protein